MFLFCFEIKTRQVLSIVVHQCLLINMSKDSKECTLLPHHEQLDLCTTRLPYRQGRKLTAVKVYSINNESKHLLVFGVPSLNLRQETKALFSKFGKLQFNLTKYPSEPFTETYHAIFENIQSARLAKKFLDTKNFYGGNLHICYAPELETLEETREKLLQRQKSVLARLKNLQKTEITPINEPKNNVINEKDLEKNNDGKTIYMGTINHIQIGKRKSTVPKSAKIKIKKSKNIDSSISNFENKTEKEHIDTFKIENANKSNIESNNIEVIDFTSADTDVLTNINETLNYNSFGKELIKEVPYKPVNKIKFNLNKNS